MDKNVVLARKYGRAIYEIAAEQNSLRKNWRRASFNR